MLQSFYNVFISVSVTIKYLFSVFPFRLSSSDVSSPFQQHQHQPSSSFQLQSSRYNYTVPQPNYQRTEETTSHDLNQFFHFKLPLESPFQERRTFMKNPFLQQPADSYQSSMPVNLEDQQILQGMSQLKMQKRSLVNDRMAAVSEELLIEKMAKITLSERPLACKASFDLEDNILQGISSINIRAPALRPSGKWVSEHLVEKFAQLEV
eukprot:TRINITY_DN11550_c0_g1_i1.p1 TRINITY_DN11550_c0_g1~~TRINITY_DN11550_c0_g1_i1.p1  ORF type:complete len:208 (-),score=44.25 TRINITY_DN11550_c0_g1_i1:73-696(-)